MPSYGVTTTGLVIPTTDELIADLNAAFLANIDPALDLSPASPFGQVVAILADRFAQVWEALATAYGGFDPDKAEGDLLIALCALTGTVKRAAKPTIISATLNLNASVTVPAGRTVQVNGDPTRQATLQADVVSVGSGNYTGTFSCTRNGPVPFPAGTMTQIVTPVAGWNSVTNALDGILGNDADTDTVLRTRRKDELAAPGADTVDAISADLLEIAGMDQAFCFENTSDATDANNVPPHSIECVVDDGATPAVPDATIAQTVWNGKPSGVRTYGSSSAVIQDSTLTNRTVYFSRATRLNVWLEIDIVVDSTFPSTGIQDVKDQIALLGSEALKLGVSVIAERIKSYAFSVTGVTDVTALRLGFTAAPVGTSNLAITSRQRAIVDTSRILVNGV